MYEENFAVAILVVAAGQSAASGKRLPGPAVHNILYTVHVPILYLHLLDLLGQGSATDAGSNVGSGAADDVFITSNRPAGADSPVSLVGAASYILHTVFSSSSSSIIIMICEFIRLVIGNDIFIAQVFVAAADLCIPN